MNIRNFFILSTFGVLSSLGSHLFAAEKPCGKFLDQIILKFNTVSSLNKPDLGSRFWNTFSKDTELPIQSIKPMPSGAYLIVVDSEQLKKLSTTKNLSRNAYFNQAITQLLKRSDVKYADRDFTFCPIRPSDINNRSLLQASNLVLISHASQWDEFNGPGGVFLESSPGAFDGAWAITLGYANPPVVLTNFEAINSNADLNPNLLSPGWSFVKNNTDTSDPKEDHGTHTAGTIAATGSVSGIAGMGPLLKILPIEVEITASGIETAIYWAMGRTVYGVPHNNYPAKVISMSFRNTLEVGCPVSLQEAIDTFINDNNGTITVSAGNDDEPASNNPPRSCSNVFVVAATQIDGYRAEYSNYGPRVTLAAPGGEQPNGDVCESGGILSTVSTNTGCQNSGFSFYQGTSMATPHVAGIAGLIYALNPNISAQEVKNILLESVMPFGSTADPERSCKGIKSCGIGIVNANNAVQLAISGRTIIAAPSPTDLGLQSSYDPFNRCPLNKYVPTVQSIASPITSKWMINKSTRACQILEVYENPTLQVNGQQLKVIYGKTVFTLQTPGLTCQVNNAHGFIC
ncbi:S8 family serine peptidase [Legionella sainthelensi]|uniref:S8 family serine peptidase n=1 Tax=Legionella sainthelensi TaxID=28087 RepID=UPI00216531F8|nr:S8 family serine peptidase [Legionella sainthelensi]